MLHCSSLYSLLEQRAKDYWSIYLIFIKLAILIRWFAFALKGNNNETNEYVNHEKGNDDNVDEIEAGHYRSIVVDRTKVLLIWIDWNVKDA